MSVDNLTEVEVEARKKAWKFQEYYRKNIPGFEKCFIMDTAPQIGIRCSRRMVGEHVIDHRELLKGTLYPDTIGVLPDHHHVFSLEHPHWHIPYRSLRHAHRENLLAAGRLLSADPIANELLRPIQGCILMVRGRRYGGSSCCEAGVTPRNVDVKTLQRQLS
jgi:hypothetical protein